MQMFYDGKIFVLKAFFGGEPLYSFGIRMLRNITKLKRYDFVVIFLKCGFPVGSNLEQMSVL